MTMKEGDSGSRVRRTYILDTNVLIHDPEGAIFSFEEHDVVIPLTVVEELDGLKKGPGEIPFSARHALKLIDSLRKTGDITKGVELPGGGSLSVEDQPKKMLFKEKTPDNKIISLAGALKDKNGKKVILISKDTSVRIKAEVKGILSEDYLKDKTSIYERYGKILSGKDYANGILSVRYQISGDTIFKITGQDNKREIRREKSIADISPRNIEQECALDALRSPDVRVVALTGIAGSGKTLLSLAVGYYQTTKNDPIYSHVLVSRPTISMGGKTNELGYLPGTKEEKLDPWMQPIYDNLELIVPTSDEQRDKFRNSQHNYPNYPSYQYLLDRGIIQIESLQHIRGRSLPKRYFIVDESQNLRPIDVKTILTRCGEGTKIILTGDLEQIDTPFLDAESNGLAYLIGKFINEEDFCYLHLPKSERGSIAEKAARLL